MNRTVPILAAILLGGISTSAIAQLRLPVIFPLGRSQPAPPPPGMAPPVFNTPEALQSDLIVKAGTDTIYFPARGAALDANATTTLAAQARWLLANPYLNVRLEGHGGAEDSRDYALAIGDKRANAVRDFLILQGIAPNRISVISWGKERPGTMRIGTSVVATGPRVVTVVVPAPPPFAPPPVPGQ
jgi:peptidoglycan-associated lipoprotein